MGPRAALLEPEVHVLLALLLLVATASGDDLGDTGLVAGSGIAEYRRVTDELHKLAARDAWAGVERYYVAALETGIAPTAEDHVAGAHAAAARGDVGATRDRLLAAHALEERRDIVDWLWTIDSEYGAVDVVAGPEAALLPEVVPFDPRKAAAVAWAAGSLGATGRFQGLLPVGAYEIGGARFEVAAGRPVAMVRPPSADDAHRRGRLDLPFSR